ncbi:hypothetical protein GQ44DRAFT_680548 [Phaeosphaeriaceae sp. PMI808]|nr:hypothetical protein GQ44DRAFT_680548 [Phaeosphaeriaceae sp. PMI808]
MVSTSFMRRWLLPVDVLLPALIFSVSTTAEVFPTAVSSVVQDGLIKVAAITCPVAQDGNTYDTFPWTHNPTCVNVVLPTEDVEELGVHQTFCSYTNVNYNNGRGVSFVVSPETAASVTFETFGMAVGGLEGQIGEEMGMWQVGDTKDKGKGLFVKNDIGAVFAGESLIIATPVLLVSKELLDTPSTKLRDLSWEVSEALDITKTNGVEVNWPWLDSMPQFLAITPEVARINHACRPNASWRFNDYTLAFDVFALKELKPGEEITLNGYEKRSYGRRTSSILANHNFKCLCSLCTSSESNIEASNDRLSEIKALKSVLPTNSADSPQLLGLLPNLIKLYDEEDLHTETPMYEEILAYTWSAFGIADRAKYWAGRARRHWLILAGKESWEARRCGDLEDDVESHATWMTWEGDPWEGVGQGHPWEENTEDTHTRREDDEELRGFDQRPARDQFRGHT